MKGLGLSRKGAGTGIRDQGSGISREWVRGSRIGVSGFGDTVGGTFRLRFEGCVNQYTRPFLLSNRKARESSGRVVKKLLGFFDMPITFFTHEPFEPDICSRNDRQ